MGVQNNGSGHIRYSGSRSGMRSREPQFKSNPGGIFLGYINTLASLLRPCRLRQRQRFVTRARISRRPQHFPSGPRCMARICSAMPAAIASTAETLHLDFSIYKNFPVRKISEAPACSSGRSFFNILNHPNFAPPLPFFGQSKPCVHPDGSQTGGGGLEGSVTQPRTFSLA